MLEKSSKFLKGRKNLLAFSGGVDSTALFFLLLKDEIDFDIAIVDYARRENSKQEVVYAENLAKTYNKKCFKKKIILKDSNFEHNARISRYTFFEEIIKNHSYKNLLTAHQLNDKLEWFLMQFTKGAGAVELLGFELFEKRESYNLVRPLINVSKQELLEFLNENNIKYFEDESNKDLKHTRNKFRFEFSNKLLGEFKSGIVKSFAYLEEDKKKLFKLDIIKQIDDLYILKNSGNETGNLRAIDKIIKKLGVIISTKERQEIIRQKDIVIAHKIAVCITDEKIYISPFIESIMEKEFKELCRISKIPPKIRAYLQNKKINPQALQTAD